MDAYTGQVRLFAGTFTPAGWAICDGASLKVEEYPALYALIGNVYGGDYANFNLPDLRGRLPLHLGQGPNMTVSYTIGQPVGMESVKLPSQDFLAAHSHVFNATSVAADHLEPQNFPLLGEAAYPFYMPTLASGFENVPLDTRAVAVVGQGEAHDNNMPTMVLKYIICLSCIFPGFD